MMAVAIVGGGITGLVLGRELDRAGVEFVLLEAADRPGGVIRSAEVEGRVLDWGPQRARLTRPMAALVEEVGLAGEVVTAPPGLGLFVYRGGRLRRVPFSLAELVRSDVVSLGGKLRLLREPFTAGPRPGERVSAFFERKLGREFYETVVAPLYGGLYASDPADMEVGLSLLHVLREVGAERSLAVPLLRNRGRIDPPAACTFRGGMAALPLAVAATLGDRLRLKAPVVGLERTGTGWRLSLGEEPAAQASGPASWEARGTPRPAGPDTLEAEVVVLTTPAPVTARLLEKVAPEASAAIGSLRYNPLGVVHLEARTDLRGLGFQVAFTERELALRGVTFNDSLFGRRDLYTAYLGGARHPEVVDLDDGELAERAVSEFRHTTGFEARPLSVARERMPAWDVSWKAIERLERPGGLELPGGLHVAANWRSRPGLPGRLADAARTARRLATGTPREKGEEG